MEFVRYSHCSTRVKRTQLRTAMNFLYNTAWVMDPQFRFVDRSDIAQLQGRFQEIQAGLEGRMSAFQDRSSAAVQDTSDQLRGIEERLRRLEDQVSFCCTLAQFDSKKELFISSKSHSHLLQVSIWHSNPQERVSNVIYALNSILDRILSSHMDHTSPF